MCLGVFDRWSSPRMTWLISIAASSTHDREVVERRAVRADDDEVAAERVGVDRDVAADDVVELDHARRRRGSG